MFRVALYLPAFWIVLSAGPALAQFDDPPAVHVPLRPLTQKDRDQRQALYEFAEGVICEHQERLLEAMRAYERAAQLDPEAVDVQKALVLIYIAVERQQDAGALLQKVLELAPNDYQMCYLRACQLRNQGQLEEACQVLQSGLRSPDLPERPELHQQMEFELGVLCERLGRHEQAAQAFARAAAILDHPDGLLEGRLSPEDIVMRSAEMHERTGRNFLDAGKCEEAAAAFRRAQAKYPPGAGRLHFHLAQVSLKQGKTAEALAALEQYLALMPQGTEAYELKIVLLQKLKRDADILPWLEQASTRDCFNVSLRLLWANQCARSGQFAAAEKIYRELADGTPTEAVYRELFLLYKDQHPKGAEVIVKLVNTAVEGAATRDGPGAAQAKAMVGALRENPAIARAVLPTAAALHKTLHPDTLQLLAALADRLDMLAEAELFYLNCIQRPLSPVAEPAVYGSLLRVLWKARRYEAIVEVCRTGLAQTRACNRVILRGDLARALAQLERWEDAGTEINTAVLDAKDTERFAMRHLRVRIFMQAGRLDLAETECLALLKDAAVPGDALEVRYLLSSVYSQTKRLPQAEMELQECLKIDAANAVVNNDLGYLWADQNKNLKEAEDLIRRAIEQDRKNRQSFVPPGPEGDREFRDNGCYIDSLGWVLFRQGRLAEARLQLEYAATLPDNDDPVIWDHLGDVYRALGEPARAVESWRHALHCYDEGKRRKMDERSRVLHEKLKQLETLHTP
jgi:tetratricopeptide (TPR) repeat protein